MMLFLNVLGLAVLTLLSSTILSPEAATPCSGSPGPCSCMPSCSGNSNSALSPSHYCCPSGGTLTCTSFQFSNSVCSCPSTQTCPAHAPPASPAPVTPAPAVTLNQPMGLAFVPGSAAGTLYIANSNANAVYRRAPSGTLSSYSSGGSLSGPWGIACHPSTGDLYVANQGGGTITAIRSGVQSTFLNVAYPIGLALDNSFSNLYITTVFSNTVYKTSVSGTVGTLQSFASLPNGRGLAFNKVGELFVASDNNVYRITSSGAVSILASLPGTGFLGLAIDGQSNLYVSASNIIKRITPSGSMTTFISSGLNGNWFLLTDPVVGTLYVGNSGGNYITQYSVSSYCAGVSCGYYGTCTPSTGVCGCTSGWSGTQCEIAPYSGSPPSAASSSQSNTGAIAGGSAGGVIVVAVTVAVIWYYCLRRSRQTKSRDSTVPNYAKDEYSQPSASIAMAAPIPAGDVVQPQYGQQYAPDNEMHTQADVIPDHASISILPSHLNIYAVAAAYESNEDLSDKHARQRKQSYSQNPMLALISQASPQNAVAPVYKSSWPSVDRTRNI